MIEIIEVNKDEKNTQWFAQSWIIQCDCGFTARTTQKPSGCIKCPECNTGSCGG